MATLYWGPSGGTSTGTWSGASATNWFTDVGRVTPSASAPTSADDVVFDGASDNGASFNVTTGASAVCRNLTASGLDQTMTLTITAAMSIHGSLSLPATNFTRAGFQTLNFLSTSAGNTITTNGVSFVNLFIFDGVGGSWILQDNLTNAAGTTLTNGTLNLNGNTYTDTVFTSSNSNTRSIAFGSGKIVLTGGTTNIWAFQTATNFTYTGTPRVESNNAGVVNRNILHGSVAGATEANAPNFYVLAGSGNLTVSNAKILDLTGFSGSLTNVARTIYGNLIISTGTTVTAGANATTFAATSGTQQITTNGKTLDFPIIQNGVGGTVQLQDNLTMGSTRTFTLTAGDLHINNRTLSTGLFNSNNSNTRIIDFKSGNITVTGNAGGVWDCRTATNLSILGTPIVNCTYAGVTGTRIIRQGDTAGGSAANAVSVNVSAGSDTVSFTAGGHFLNLDFTGFSGIGAPVVSVYGNFTMSATQTTFSTTTATTFAGTSGTQQITTNGVTVNNPLTFNGIGGTFAFQDALTQLSTRAFTVTNGTVQLKNGVTSTVGAFTTSGANQKFLQSTTPGSQATLSQASGTVDVSNLAIRDINAVGGATWNAFVNQQNVDAGNNDGWDFGISPIVGSYEYTYQLRSFTQPRRF